MGMGTEREREQERGWRRTKERRTGTGTGVDAGRGRGRGQGWRPVDEHQMGTETEARTVAEMGTGTRITGTTTRIGSGKAEERRKSARKHKTVVDTMQETGETWLEGKRKNVEKKGLVQ